MNDEFIENPLVSWKTLFDSGDEDEKDAEAKDKKTVIKSGEAAEDGAESASGTAAPAAVPADIQPGE